jgi:hypothetical protein
MKFTRAKLSGLRSVLAACILGAPLLVACAKSALPVSIHGVNYSAEPFSFVLQDPADSKNKGDGELVDSYAAGGTTCCYVLPKKWQPGMKVSIESKHWLGKAADNSLHDVASTQLVEIPRYADGKAGELWVLRAADGTMDIVSSDFQPDHPKWPGRIKGWPVPSLAYQRERWDIDIDHQKFFLNAYEQLSAKFKVSPDDAAQEEWSSALKHDKNSLAGYSGPNDVEFRKKLQQDNEAGLARVRARLKQIQQERP